MDLEQLTLLGALCIIFFFLVLVNGAFKMYINIYKGRMGERMLRRLRYLLYSRILRFPLAHFRKVSQGELIPMITAEVEPLGGFIGDGAVIDRQFHTTDVCVVVKTDMVTAKYRQHYETVRRDVDLG